MYGIIAVIDVDGGEMGVPIMHSEEDGEKIEMARFTTRFDALYFAGNNLLCRSAKLIIVDFTDADDLSEISENVIKSKQ